MPIRSHYLHHRIDCEPLAWQSVAKALAAKAPAVEAASGLLFGVWRSQIGQPRDTLNAITAWHEGRNGWAAVMDLIKAIDGVRVHDVTAMTPTLRPANDTPPRRQGNFAFRWFETPTKDWQEFLDLCADAWPGFESAYDSQVIGLWKVEDDDPPSRSGDVGALEDPAGREGNRRARGAQPPLRPLHIDLRLHDDAAHGRGSRRHRALDLSSLLPPTASPTFC
jgi:hypothetical protein